MRAHALVLRSRFHHSQAPLPRSAEFGSCQHWRLFGLQRVSLAGWSARPGPLCFHSAPALPKSLGNTKFKKGGEGREGREIKLVVFKCKQNSSLHTTQKHAPVSFEMETADLYISCTTDKVHTNRLAVRLHSCIHFFVPLPHKQLAHPPPHTHRSRGYVIYHGQRALMSTEYKHFPRFGLVEN